MKKVLTTLFTLALAGMSSLAAVAAEPEITVIAEADFTTVTAGSPEAPVAFPSYGEGSFGTLFPKWTQSSTMQAGGQILIKDGGNVATPSSNMSANGGTVRITAQVKAMDSYGGMVSCKVGYSSTSTVLLPDQEWHSIEVIMGGGSSYSKVTVSPMLSASGLLVRNIKVDQSPAFIAAPTVYQPTQADGTSFTAKWKTVTGATGYFLDVYTKTASGEKEYLAGYENKTVTGTSCNVTGLNPDKTYYYCMRVTNGIGTSSDSEEIRVVKILTSLDAPTGLNGNGDKTWLALGWNSVENAQAYVVDITRVETLTSARDVDVLNEQFSKATSGTLENIEFVMYADRYTSAPGWDGAELGTAKGIMVLTPTTGYPSWLSTPAIDLSHNEGAFTVRLNMAEGRWGTMYTGGNVEVMVLNAAGDTVQTKSVTIDSQDFKEYTVAMTGGSNGGKVVIRYAGDKKIFIDSMAISQFCQAGTEVRSLVKTDQTENCSYRYTFEENTSVTYSVTVQAAAETVKSGDITWIYSSPSAPLTINPNHKGVDAMTSDEMSVRVCDGHITVTAPAPAIVTVYTLTGTCLLSGQVNAGTTVLPVDAKGVILVKAGAKVYKVIL